MTVYIAWNEQLQQGEPMSAARARAAASLAQLEKDFLALARERGLP